MHVVIKETSTIAEFKAEKEKMEHLTNLFYQRHKEASDIWTAGEPVKAWWGMGGNLWIEYAVMENGLNKLRSGRMSWKYII